MGAARAPRPAPASVPSPKAAPPKPSKDTNGASPKLRPAGLPPKATVRSPARAEELKAKLGKLASATGQIRALKRGMSKNFYEIGQILQDIEFNRLYEAKGYGNFEAFLEREIDIGKQVGLKVVRIVQVFLRDAAVAAGFDRLSAALDAMDGAPEESYVSDSQPPPSSRSAIPLLKL
jgi:hypothetical protein